MVEIYLTLFTKKNMEKHILNGATITVRPYYPFLDEKVTDVARNIKKAIQVSPDIMDHVSNRCDKEFLQEFGFDVETAKYDEDTKQLTFPTTLSTGELIEEKKSKQSRAILTNSQPRK